MCIRDRSMTELERFRKLEWEMQKYPQIQSLKEANLLLGTRTVSYTHLDVYKRQEFRELMTNSVWYVLLNRCGLDVQEYLELKTVLTPEEYAAARASTLNAHYTPVSYTHLDVYKRQLIIMVLQYVRWICHLDSIM